MDGNWVPGRYVGHKLCDVKPVVKVSLCVISYINANFKDLNQSEKFYYLMSS